MGNSKIIEKRKVKKGSRYMLLVLEIEPKEIKVGRNETIKTNRYITPENWILIDKAIDSLIEDYVNCKKRDDWKVDVKKEVEIPAINYKITYVFQNETQKDLINTASFQLTTKDCYKILLSAVISDESGNLKNRISELEKQLEELKKEREEIYTPFQETQQPIDVIEYKASPPNAKFKEEELRNKEELASTDPEYVPQPVNGSSANHTYKPTKINGDGSDIVESEPYEPQANHTYKPTKINSDGSDMVESEPYVPKPTYIPTSSKDATQKKEKELKTLNVTKRKRQDKKADESPKATTLDAWINSTPKQDKKIKKSEKKKTDMNKPDDLFGSSSSEENIMPKSDPYSKQSSEEKEDFVLKKPCMKKRKCDNREDLYEPEASTVMKYNSKDKKEKEKPLPTMSSLVLVPREEALRQIEELKATSDMIDVIRAASGFSDDNIPPRKKVEYVTLHDLEIEDITDTFVQFKEYLTSVYQKYKDYPERYLKSKTDLIYYTEVFNVFSESQIMGMVKFLEKYFGIDSTSGQHSDFFFNHLVSEWTLKVYMYRFGFEFRDEALARIRQQEIDYPFQNDPVLPPMDKKEKVSRKRR